MHHSQQRNYSQSDVLQVPSFEYLSSRGQVRDNLHDPTLRASPNLSQNEGSHSNTLITSSIHPQRALHAIDISQEATESANRFWCTTCEDRRSFKSKSDWRKHEKGHVDVYVCKLCGPALVSCKRRADLVKHLRNYHEVENKAQGEGIADTWKETTNKQAWSCGFCVYLFHTFGDRLQHIAKHFEDGQTLNEWDITKVIEGLLKQPGLTNIWRMPLEWKLLDTPWKKDAVKQLQHDLELGPSDPSHAQALVQAVYNARQSDWHPIIDGRPLTLAANHIPSGPSALASISDHALVTNRMFQPSSDHQQSHFPIPAENLRGGFPAQFEDLINTDDYSLPLLNDASSSINVPWPLTAHQTRSSTAGPNMSHSFNQEESNATTGLPTWSTPAAMSDDPDDTNMWA